MGDTKQMIKRDTTLKDVLFYNMRTIIEDDGNLVPIETNSDVPFDIERIFYVYGSNQRKNSLLPTLIRYMKNKQQFNVKKPNLINDYIYIKDVVSAIIKCINIKKSTTLNICSGKPTSNYKFIKTFEKLSNYKILNKKSGNKKKYGFYGSNQVLKKLKWILWRAGNQC